MIHDLVQFELSDPEDIEFAKHWLTDNSKKMILGLTGFKADELLVLIKGELLWYKRKDILKRLTARYAKTHRQYEWKLILNVIEGKESLHAIQSYGERHRNVSTITG